MEGVAVALAHSLRICLVVPCEDVALVVLPISNHNNHVRRRLVSI